MTDKTSGSFRDRETRPTRPQVVVEPGRTRRQGDSPGVTDPPRPWIRQGVGATEVTSVFRRLYGKERSRHEGETTVADHATSLKERRRTVPSDGPLPRDGKDERPPHGLSQGRENSSLPAGGVLVSVHTDDFRPEEVWYVGTSEGKDASVRTAAHVSSSLLESGPQVISERRRREIPLESPRTYVLAPSGVRRQRNEALAWVWTILAAVVLGIFLGYIVLWLMAHSDMHRSPEDIANNAAGVGAHAGSIPASGTVHLAPQRFYLLQVGAYQDASKAEAAASALQAKGVMPIAVAEDVQRLFTGLAAREGDARLLARAYEDLGVEVYVKTYVVPERDVDLSTSDAETGEALGDFLTAFTFLVEKASIWTAAGVQGPVTIDEEAWREFRDTANRFYAQGEMLGKRLDGPAASSLTNMRIHLEAAVAGMVKYVEKSDNEQFQVSQGELVRAFLAYREFLSSLAQNGA